MAVLQNGSSLACDTVEVGADPGVLTHNLTGRPFLPLPFLRVADVPAGGAARPALLRRREEDALLEGVNREDALAVRLQPVTPRRLGLMPVFPARAVQARR